MGKGRWGAVSLAATVGALAAFAISPIPLHFDAEWLAWVLIPVFSAVGALVAFVYPKLG